MNQRGAIVLGRALGLMGLGPWPCNTVHNPDPVRPMFLIRTLFKAQQEPKYPKWVPLFLNISKGLCQSVVH